MDDFQSAGLIDADGHQQSQNTSTILTNTQHVATPGYTEKGRVESKLRFYCFGKAAENKELDSDMVEFYPMEHMPFADGEINSDKIDYQEGGEEYIGGGYNVTVKTSNSMQAFWQREGQSNRLTSPDVRRGERLKIYQYADTDKYYWETMGTDNHLRRLETVIHGYSSDPDNNTQYEKLGYENSYSMEVSTHKKWMRIHTTQLNGETVGYDIELNLDRGFFQIEDTKGNIISIDSERNRIEMINADGSHYDMHGPKLEVTIPDSISFLTGHYRIQAGAVTFATGRLGVTGTIVSGGPQITPLHALGTFGDDGVAMINNGSSGSGDTLSPGRDVSPPDTGSAEGGTPPLPPAPPNTP